MNAASGRDLDQRGAAFREQVARKESIRQSACALHDVAG